MKKLFLLLALFGFVLTACEGGDGVEEDNGGTPFTPEITISPEELSFPVEGGEQEVIITSNVEYEVSERASWLSVEQTETGLIITADESKNTSERTAYISITNEKYSITKTIDIVQEAWVPKIELAQQSIEVEFEPAEYEVAVTSPYSWEATTDKDWIVVTTETGIAGEEVLKFSAKRNEEEKERKGTITLKNGNYNLVAELYVTQKAFAPEWTVEPEALNFAVEGGTQEIAITANFEYEFSTTADWLTIEKSDKGISVTAPNYVEVDERTAEITISSEKYGISKIVNVTQGAFVPEWTVEPEALNFAIEGGTQEIAITANFEYAYSANADWLSIEKSENGLKVTAQYAIAFEERITEIIISNEKYGISKKVSVSQSAISKDATNFILYTSSDSKVVTPYKTNVFGANIVSNTYNNGQGIIVFDAPVTSIGERAFSDCTSLTSVTIPDSVTSIGERAFQGCSSLTSVTIPDSVTSIGDYAFSGCYSLRSVTIPDSVTSIGDGAFYNCTSLASVTIPDSVTSIGDYTFFNCKPLTSVTIPNSVTLIGYETFYNCYWLRSVTIPDSVTSIGGSAFSGCSSLTSVNVQISDLKKYCTSNPMSNIPGEKHLFVNGSEITELTIPDSVTSIGDYAFRKCTSLTSVTIPDSVTSIGSSAFYDCTSLKEVYYKGDLSAWCKIDFSYYYSNPCYNGAKLFIDDVEVIDITIPSDITEIKAYTFYNCYSLTSVTIGNSVTSIGNWAFRGCSSLTSVNVQISDLKKYCTSNPMSNIPGEKHLFVNGSEITELTIPDSVTSIGSLAFDGCSSLTSVTIPDSVTSIGSSAFYGCTGKLTVNCNISSRAFFHSKFSKVTIGDSVTSIGDYAFQSCTSLTSVTIGNSVTSIGDEAFRDCTSLTSVYCKSTTPPTGGSNMFSYYDNEYHLYYGPFGCTIYVPRNSVEAYKSAWYRSDYANYIKGYDF